MAAARSGRTKGARAARRDVPSTGLGLLLREAYRAFSREFYAHLAHHGLTHAQWLHLWLLSRAGTLNCTFLVSPGASVTRVNALSSLAGRRTCVAG